MNSFLIKIFNLVKNRSMLKVVFSLCALCFIFITQNVQIENIFNAPLPIFILLSVIIYYLKFLVSTFRFYILLLSQKMNVKFSQTIKWTIYSRFLDTLTPTSFTSDFIKLYTIKEIFPHKSIQHNFTLIMLDKLIAFAALFILSLLAYILYFTCIIYNSSNIQNALLFEQYFLLFAILGVLFFIIACVLSKNRAILKVKNALIKDILKIKILGKLLKQIILILALLQRNTKEFILVILSSILAQICAILSLLFVVMAFGENFEILPAFFILPLSFISNMFGFMGGIGVGTLGIGFCLSHILNVENAYFLVLLNQSINLISKIPFVFIYLSPNTSKNKKA